MSIAAEPQLPAPWRIVERRQDTADVFTWVVAPLGDAGMDCAPGQFNMLYAHGIGEVPIPPTRVRDPQGLREPGFGRDPSRTRSLR